MLVVNFELPPGGSISTSPTVLVNCWPATWRININFANVGRKFLTWRPQESLDKTRQMYINFANFGSEFLIFRLEDLYQLRQRRLWIFDLRHHSHSAYSLQATADDTSTLQTLIVNFWPATPKHQRMTHGESMSTAPKLVVNFCKRLTQGTVSKIPQTVRPRVALQLDLETAYFAGCQRVVHQLVRGWILACPRGCASESSKASLLQFSLTRKLHIWLAVKELYISLLEAEHWLVRGAVHRTPRRHLGYTSAWPGNCIFGWL